ncbi:MAG: GNAT family N-acetyltransferase [Nannocystaceae bacterium]
MASGSVHLRDAALGDHGTVVRLFPDLLSGDAPPALERWRERYMPTSRIVEVDGVAAGYLYYEVLDGVGYIRNVVVDPGLRGRGLGRALVTDAGALMRGRGCARWQLNVRPENTPAIELYRSVGLEVVFASVALRLAWELVDRLPSATRPLEVVAAGSDELARIAAAFDLPPGQLEQLAAVPKVHVRRLRDRDDPGALDLGVAAFDVGFPGCFPFRVARPGDVGALLRGLRPLAEHDLVGVVVEGDDALAELLIDAGAAVKLRFVHMRGPIRVASPA